MRRELLLALYCIVSVSCLADNPSEEHEGHEDNKVEPDLRITTIILPPFVMIKNDTEGEGTHFEGFLVDFLEHISKKTGLSYSMKLVVDGKFGHNLPSGDWNGMIGELKDGVADLAVAPLTVTSIRRTAVSFTHSFMTVYLTALVPRDSDINTVEELVNQTDISYGTIAGGSTVKSFRSAPPPGIYSKMWSSMASASPSVFVNHLEEGVARVREGDFAFIMESPQAEYEVSKYPCDVRTIERFSVQDTTASYAFAMPKGHDLYSDVNEALLDARKEGVLTELYRKWWKRESCDKDGATGAGGNGSSMVRASVVLLTLYLFYILL